MDGAIPSIPLAKRLEPYFKIAEDTAKNSPCTRRQYGSVVIEAGPWIRHWTGYNQRLSKCCNGICARDRFKTLHGQRVEVGAEIHSETAALINAGKQHEAGFQRHFVLVGYDHGNELTGTNVYPCHSCILAIKFAGFTYIHIKDRDGYITPVSVNEILQYREAEWEDYD